VAGAATVVWAEPSIRGLVSRPAYAAGASGFPDTISIDLMVTLPGPPPGYMPGDPLDQATLDAMRPIITDDGSTATPNPFGHGALRWLSNVQPAGRPIVRLRGNQEPGNEDASISAFSTSGGLELPENITTGNNGLGVRWPIVPDASSGTLTLTIVCA